MRLLVLAGGFGTRLKSAIADVPKALAPIGGVPFLQLQIENWVAQGVSEFTFLLHHQAEQIIQFLRSRQGDFIKAYQVDWLIEQVPMDTGGAIANAVRELGLHDDFLIANADTWLGGGIHEMMQVTAPSIAVVNLPDVSRYGKVQFDQRNMVTAFIEKNEKSASGWVNAGLYRLPAGLFEEWDGRPFSLERSMFSTLVNNHKLNTLPLRADFIDIGVPDDYYRFCSWVSAGRKKPLCN